MLQTFKNGQGSIVLRVKLLDSTSTTGGGLTGLTSASSGLLISTIADNESTATAYAVASSKVETIATLGTYAAPTATKCRFKEVDATNHKGVYELQIADARFAVANAKSLLVSISGAANLAEADFVVQLQSDDPYVAKPANFASSVAQTGDSYARLGAPATASVSGDLAVIAGYIDTEVAAIKAKTDNLPASPAAVGSAMTLTSGERNSIADAAFLRQMTEAYRADGAAPTLAQALCELLAHLGEASIGDTTKTLKKFDGSTTAATFTLDDATTPTAITRTG